MSLLNLWRKYPNKKPKEDGLYLCTVGAGTNTTSRMRAVIPLYYNARHDTWTNKQRQNVFEGYKVYKHGRPESDETRVYSDELCNRTVDVVAWKEMSTPYGN